jgi:GT2 family glycosyltransferase
VDNLCVPEQPTASILIPTRARPHYLDVTLGSVATQARAAGADLLVLSDGPDPATTAVAERHGARLVSLPSPRGLNAARNAGIAAASGELLVFIDDDVETPPGWLDALLGAARAAPEHEVFGGPIRPRLEGYRLPACGRESAPITTLELGASDRDVALVYGANMAIRRSAFARVGNFDETLAGRGDEEEWERRYTAQGGRIRYVARAGLVHRRARADATLRALARADYRLGRSARRNDVRKRQAPPLRAELRTLAGCMYHTFRRRCANGIVMAAHTAGRIREALAELHA